MYSVLQVLEYEWQKSLWILKNVVIACILSESNEKLFTDLVRMDFCITEYVNSFENVASVQDWSMLVSN